MNKLNKLTIALLCTVALSAMASDNSVGGSHQGNGASTVDVSGVTHASATGNTVMTYGQTTVQGTHVAPNGTTNFYGDTGAQGNGSTSAQSSTKLIFGEMREGSTNAPTVHNFGSMTSRSVADAAERTEAWGDMRTNGNLDGPHGSSTNFTQSHGYDAIGGGSALGNSSHDLNAEYNTTVGTHHHMHEDTLN